MVGPSKRSQFIAHLGYTHRLLEKFIQVDLDDEAFTAKYDQQKNSENSADQPTTKDKDGSEKRHLRSSVERKDLREFRNDFLYKDRGLGKRAVKPSRDSRLVALMKTPDQDSEDSDFLPDGSVMDTREAEGGGKNAESVIQGEGEGSNSLSQTNILSTSKRSQSAPLRRSRRNSQPNGSYNDEEPLNDLDHLSLEIGESTNSEDPRFTCPHCGKAHTQNCVLQTHLYSKHFKVDCQEGIRRILARSGLVCPLCPEKCWKQGATVDWSMVMHFARTHSIAADLINHNNVRNEENIDSIMKKFFPT